MRRRQRGQRGRGVRERGAVAVEFALVFCFVLVPLTLGMIDYGWYFYSSQVTGSATRETARRLSVGDCQATDAARDYAREQAGFTTLTLRYGTTTGFTDTLPPVGSTLRVEASTNGRLIGFIPLPGLGTITKTVDTRVEDDTEDSPC